MATISYTIYSHYDAPKEPEPAETEVSLDSTESTPDTPEEKWPKIRRPFAPPPTFVPATNTSHYWEIDGDTSPGGGTRSTSNQSRGPVEEGQGVETVARWYRSLLGAKLNSTEATKADPGSNASTATSTPNGTPDARSTPPSGSSSQPVQAIPRTVSQTTYAKPSPESSARRTREKRNKNNWFIMNALQNETPTPTPTPPSLADILERDPPPLPNEARYHPPVFLAIGPSNKGFAMLSRSGWNEGEPLGPDEIRRQYGSLGSRQDDGSSLDFEGDHVYSKRPRPSPRNPIASVKREFVEVDPEGDDEVVEIKEVDVIDLTLSDSEPSSRSDLIKGEDIGEYWDGAMLEKECRVQEIYGVDEDFVAPADDPPSEDPDGAQDSLAAPNTPGINLTFADSVGHPSKLSGSTGTHERKALITPLATVLKADRLGIGLKAKTVGPYKASQKRITHNAAALAVHIRQSEEMRKKKYIYGKGKRGFSRQYKLDESKRQQMLSDLNS